MKSQIIMKLMAISLLIIFYYAITACADLNKEAEYWNEILKETSIPALKNVRLATEEDLLVFKDYGKSKQNGDFIYKLNVDALI